MRRGTAVGERTRGVGAIGIKRGVLLVGDERMIWLAGLARGAARRGRSARARPSCPSSRKRRLSPAFRRRQSHRPDAATSTRSDRSRSPRGGRGAGPGPVHRLARRVGDGVAVALEEPHHGHVTGEELARPGDAVVRAVVGDLDSLGRAGDGDPVAAAGIQAVAAPGVVGLVRRGGQLGQQGLRSWRPRPRTGSRSARCGPRAWRCRSRWEAPRESGTRAWDASCTR